ncbi:RNA-binding S4 domain-containing protein [Phaeovulum sp.]|uniref:RNA-binding S4 domain-containing protein n=1 Tax=Phaeovulum sp. TaxID=2934796 RepID=UPI0035623A18
MTEAPGACARIRLDKWLWHARLAKTRTLAQALVSAGHLRINGQRCDRPGRSIGPGDVLTVRSAAGVRVVRVLDCGTRRGPASEAATLFSDLSSPVPAAAQEPLE